MDEKISLRWNFLQKQKNESIEKKEKLNKMSCNNFLKTYKLRLTR